VCRQIKAQAARSTPVMMVTARDAFEDKARGFHGGADDYVTKPFDLRELALRCEALARRGALHVDQVMTIGQLTLDLRERRALWRGAQVALTHTGFKLLSALGAAHPRALSRTALLHALWGAEPPDSDALKSHLYALRKQMDLAGAPGLIVTIPQLGYRLMADGAASADGHV
jgi:DNA-binding response OmpR family regulator